MVRAAGWQRVAARRSGAVGRVSGCMASTARRVRAFGRVAGRTSGYERSGACCKDG